MCNFIVGKFFSPLATYYFILIMVSVLHGVLRVRLLEKKKCEGNKTGNPDCKVKGDKSIIPTPRKAEHIVLMSVHCRVAHPHLLLKALGVLSISKDVWVTIAFTDTIVLLHVEGTDQNVTATATLPRALFSEYTASGARFAVHLASLRDALLLGGAGPLTSGSLGRIILAYPAGDARLLVELVDGNCVRQSTLVTRPVKDRLLDLRFRDAAVANQIELLGDVARSIVEDLVVAQCPHAVVVLDPHEGVILRGEDGPHGTVTVQVKRHSEAILSANVEAAHTAARTRVLQSHLALACGVRSGGAKTWRPAAAAQADAPLGIVSASSAGSAGLPQTFGGFERLLFQINTQRQLSVIHMPRDHDVPVSVTVVVSPLCSLDDDE